MRPHGRAAVSRRHPQALAICDRCGVRYNHYDLGWQFDWRGPRLQNKRILVCRSCQDKPFEPNRVIILPPDPMPVLNPRPEFYVSDDNPIQAVGFDAVPLGTMGTSIGNLSTTILEQAFSGRSNKTLALSPKRMQSYVGLNNWLGKYWGGMVASITLPAELSTAIYPTYVVDRVVMTAPTDAPFLATGATTVQLHAWDGVSLDWTVLTTKTTAGTDGEVFTITTTDTTYYYAHRVVIAGDGTAVAVARVDFYAASEGVLAAAPTIYLPRVQTVMAIDASSYATTVMDVDREAHLSLNAGGSTYARTVYSVETNRDRKMAVALNTYTQTGGALYKAAALTVPAQSYASTGDSLDFEVHVVSRPMEIPSTSYARTVSYTLEPAYRNRPFTTGGNPWTRTNILVANNTITDPAGTTTAAAFSESTSGTTNCVLGDANTVTSGSNYTLKVYLKKGTLRYIALGFTGALNAKIYVTSVFDLQGGVTGEVVTGASGGTLVSRAITQLTADGWYLCTLRSSLNTTSGYAKLAGASAASGNSYNDSGDPLYSLSTRSNIFYGWYFSMINA